MAFNYDNPYKLDTSFTDPGNTDIDWKVHPLDLGDLGDKDLTPDVPTVTYTYYPTVYHGLGFFSILILISLSVRLCLACCRKRQYGIIRRSTLTAVLIVPDTSETDHTPSQPPSADDTNPPSYSETINHDQKYPKNPSTECPPPYHPSSTPAVDPFGQLPPQYEEVAGAGSNKPKHSPQIV